MTAVATFAIGPARFTARLSKSALPVERGHADAPTSASWPLSSPALAAVFYGNADPADAGVDVAGDPRLYRRFIALFNLPRPSTG